MEKNTETEIKLIIAKKDVKALVAFHRWWPKKQKRAATKQ